MKARLTLKVRAGARKTQFAGRYEGAAGAWRLQVAAPPVDGRANEAIVRFLAKLAGLPSSAVRIISGATGTTKIVELNGIGSDAFDRVILESHGTSTDTGRATPAEP